MSESGKSASDIRGVPAVVIKRFAHLSPTLGTFAARHKMRLEPYEGAKIGDVSWCDNLYGFVFGRAICLQVSLDQATAEQDLFCFSVFLRSVDLGLDDRTSWIDLLNRHASLPQAEEALSLSFGAALQLARGVVRRPTKATA